MVMNHDLQFFIHASIVKLKRVLSVLGKVSHFSILDATWCFIIMLMFVDDVGL